MTGYVGISFRLSVARLAMSIGSMECTFFLASPIVAKATFICKPTKTLRLYPRLGYLYHVGANPLQQMISWPY